MDNDTRRQALREIMLNIASQSEEHEKRIKKAFDVMESYWSKGRNITFSFGVNGDITANVEGSNGFYHTVSFNTVWSCSCPDAIHRKDGLGIPCKHELAVRGILYLVFGPSERKE